MKKNRFARLVSTLINKDRFVAIISVVFAVILWLVISITENPQRNISVASVPISINTETGVAGLRGLSIVSNTHVTEATVTISGPSYIASSIKSSDITVEADMQNVTEPGTYELDLVGSIVSGKSGCKIASISPSTITVSFDYVDTKIFDLNVVAVGASAVDGLVAEEPVILSENNDGTIQITAPRTEMEKVTKVCARAIVNKELDKTTQFDAAIILYDENDNEIDTSLFKLPFDKLSIAVPIYREKTVPVKLDSDLSAAAYIGYTLSMNSIEIMGEPDVVDKTTAISVSVNFAEISKSNSEYGHQKVNAKLNLPNTVKAANSETEIEIDFNLTNYTDNYIQVNNIKFENLAEGLEATSTKEGVSVKICGPASVINSLNTDKLTVIVNCADKSPGTSNVYYTVDTTSYPSIWVVGNDSTAIKITEKK